MQDHTGRTVSFFYLEGNLSEVTNPEGDKVSYRYNEEGKLRAVKNPVGTLTVRNTYDEKGRVVSQRFPDKGEILYAYEKGNRTVLTERNGSRITYIQDERCRNTDILYEDGTKEHFGYNERNQRILYVDRNGNATKMAYDDKGNLTQVINALGEKTSMTYNADNRLVSLKVNGKVKLHNRYDTAGNLVSSKGADGNGNTITYDRERRPICIEAADRSTIKVDYDERGNIKKIVDTYGAETGYEYDSLNRVIHSTDGNGNRTFFEYDAADRLRKVTNPIGDSRSYSYNASGKVIKVIDYDGYTVETQYNNLNRPETITDKEGNVTHYYYDKMWNVSRIRQADGGSINFLYDGNNCLREKQLPEGGCIQYTYDGNGNRTGVIDANGNHTNYDYDAMNRLVKMTDATGAETTYDYDEEGNITSITDAEGNMTLYTYDEMCRCTSKTDVMGNSTVYIYDEMGNIKSILYPNGGIEYRCYKNGRLTEIKKADGRSIHYAYDGNGNCIEMVNSAGEKLTFTYDAMDRTHTITNPNGGVIRYAYDALGNVTKMTDECGNETCYTYTPNGNLASVTDALGNETHYSYDTMGRLIKTERIGEMRNDNDSDRKVEIQTTLYDWNHEGLVTGITDPLGAVETLAYDKGGRVTDKWDRDGYHTRYSYDGRNLMTNIMYADGNKVSYSYNSLRNLEKIKDSTGTTQIVMDALGRALYITDSQEKTVGYEWGSMNEKTRLIYPDGKEAAYQYNEKGQLETLTTGKGIIYYAYDEMSRLKEKKFPNGITTEYEYNSIGRLERIYHTGKDFQEEYYYRYDAAGNKIEARKRRHGMAEDNGNFSFHYDALKRLTEVTKDGNLLRRYDYDVFGNRTVKEECRGGILEQTFYRYNANNQLISQSNGDENRTYSYDKRGNLTTVNCGEQLLKIFTFDAANRMSSVTEIIDGMEKQAEYRYNGLGQRVSQIIHKPQNPEKQIQYILDLTRPYRNLLMSEECVQEREQEREQTFYWDGNVTAMEEAEKNSYYLQDDLGSPMQLMDEIGDIEETYGFDEFGMSLGRGGYVEEQLQPFGFTGYQREAAGGLYFAQARRYDAQVGRFTSEDKVRGNIIAPYSLNHYGYCWNRPTDLVDLNGKFPWFVIPFVFVVAGTLTGCEAEDDTQLEMPVAGDHEYKYSPEIYNSDLYIDRTNCYAYAFDVVNNPIEEKSFYTWSVSDQTKGKLPFANQPGLFSRQFVPQNESIVVGDEVGNEKLVDLIKDDAAAIGLHFQEYQHGMMGGYAVLLVVKPGEDYHFYRQDLDGTWSHKFGFSEVFTGVSDPVQDAKALGYMTIVGYYYITEDCNIE